MWVREIVRAHRRRAFIRRAKNTVRGVVSSIRGKVSENIDMKNMEKIVTAAVLLGIKKYADRHPKLRQNVNSIMDMANGELDIDIMSTADEVAPRKKVVRAKTKATKKKK